MSDCIPTQLELFLIILQIATPTHYVVNLIIFLYWMEVKNDKMLFFLIQAIGLSLFFLNI